MTATSDTINASLLNSDTLISVGSLEEPLSTQHEKDKNGQMTMLQAVLVLTITITGIGLLSVSYCFRSGVFLNLILTLILASVSFVTFIYLIDSSVKSNIHDYSQLMSVALSSKFVIVVNIILAVLLFGVGILYIQYTYSLTSAFLKNFKGIPNWVYNRWFLIFTPVLCINFPLMCLKTMQKLSFVSFASMALVFVYFLHCAYYFGKSVKNDGFDPQKQMKYFDFSRIFLSAMGIQATSYTCHPNIFPTLVKLENGTKTRKTIVMACVVCLAYLIYTAPGLLGYFTLFDKIQDPVVITYYPSGQIFTSITTGLYALLTVFCVPLILFACRLSINDIIFKTEFTTLRWNLIALVLLVLAAIIAITVKKINSIFGIIGGVLCPLIAYILPAFYYIRICKPGIFKLLFAYFVILFGFAIIVISLYNCF